MRIRIMALVTCIICLLVLSAFSEEEERRISDGFEYTVSDGYADIVAYHGEYLPRHLPTELDGHKLSNWLYYSEDIFGDLIQDYGIYRYGPVAENEIYIVGWTGYERISSIPEEIGSIPVTGIGDCAFYCSGFTRELFAEVVIVPGSIRTIGRDAFASAGFSCIILNEGLEEIGDYAFRGHSQMNLTIPSTVRKMGANPFANEFLAGSVNGYLFPTLLSEEYFGTDRYFWSYSQYWDSDHRILFSREDMRLITCAENLVKREGYSTVYTVPDGIRIIGESAFFNAPYLTEVILPDTVEVIEDSAFAGAWRLERVTIPDSVTAIGSHAFEYTQVWELEIPSSVTVFGEEILEESKTIVCDRGSAAEAYALENGYEVRYR